MDDKIQGQAAEAAHQLLQRFRESHPQWAGDRTPLLAWTSQPLNRTTIQKAPMAFWKQEKT